MKPEIYYHILDIGVTYEKGCLDGERWHYKERNRLIDECRLWRNLLMYADLEMCRTDCSEKVFTELAEISKKYHLPNYEMILDIRDELINSDYSYKLADAGREMLTDRIIRLISEVETNVADRKGKVNAYKALHRLHNLPKALHGTDELGKCFPITPEQAMEYSSNREDPDEV